MSHERMEKLREENMQSEGLSRCTKCNILIPLTATNRLYCEKKIMDCEF